jgi:hypothetical protein
MKKLVLALAALMLALPGAATAQSCNRECLKGIADSYVAAMVAHNPRRAPLARNIVIVENLKRIKPGEGLWSTASGDPTAFKIYVPDVVAQQVGYMAVLQEGGKPIQLGLRLKVQNRRVTEAEHVVVHQLSEAGLKNLQKVRLPFSQSVPEPFRDSRGRLLHIAAAYYDALDENNGALAPFADTCVRHENGIQTARNAMPEDPSKTQFNVFGAMGCAAQLDSQIMSYITSIDNRRVWIADEETGLAFGLSHFRHAMDKKTLRPIGVPGVETWPMTFEPFDLPAVHIYKIWGGKIHEIEALGYVTAYQSPTGWEK